MNLSRAAKKFRAQMPQQPAAPRPARAKGAKTPPAPPPVPEPVVAAPPPAPAPLPEPVAPVAVPPKKGWPVKAKRPRFVREKVEKRERAAAPALPPRSTRPVARLLTRNLALLPKDDAGSPR